MKRLLLLVLVGCGSKKEAEPKPAPDPTPRQAVDAAKAPDAAVAVDAAVGPTTVTGFHFTVTAPRGWTVDSPDPVMPGNVMMRGSDAMTASIARMRHWPAPKDAAGCDEAAARLTQDSVTLESAGMTKNARFGDTCRVVHHDLTRSKRIVSELYAVGEDDSLVFMCWFTDTQQAPPADCAAIFDSIQLDD